MKKHSIEISIVKYGWRYMSHWDDAVLMRPHWRLFWGDKRGASLSHKNLELEILPDHFTILPPYSQVEQRFMSPFNIFYMNVEIPAPYNYYPEIFQFKIYKDSKSLIRKFMSSKMSETEISCTLQILSLKILTELDHNKLSLVKNMDNRITKAINYMENHYSEKIKNSDLAKQVNMATNAFIRLFSQQTGDSPQNYLQNIRLNQACSLLENSHLTIDEIAERCGFSERFYFTRVFKKRHMIGPAAYRKSEC